MRLAYICGDPGVPVFGRKGSSVHVQEVLRAFVRIGASIDLFACRVDGDCPAGLQSVRVHALPLQPTAPEAPARERAAVRANRGLRLALESCAPFDLVYERYSLWSFAGMQYARTSGAPGLLEVNAPLIDEQARHRALVHRKAAERVAARACADATSIVAVSEEVAARISGSARTSPRVHVVPNGVDVARFRPDVLPRLPAVPDTFTVGFVGTLKPWHGVSLLVRAFDLLARRHSNVRLLIVGEGPGLQPLRDDLARRGLLGISQLTGAVDPAHVPGLLASMNIAVAPYEEHTEFYFSPLKVFEYMSAGLPVVATRVGQLAGVIDDGVTGVLCSADAEALAAALERLYEDEALRVRVGRAARARAVHAHSWDSICQRVLEIAGLRPYEAALEAFA